VSCVGFGVSVTFGEGSLANGSFKPPGGAAVALSIS
jgi:hypothetical protein